MSWLTRGGITRLSELEIDADKDWQAMGITNIKELAAAMTRGDLLVRGDSILEKLLPGTLGYVLTSAGPLHLPVWGPGGSIYDRFFIVTIVTSHAEELCAPDQTAALLAPITTAKDEVIVPTKAPAITLTPVGAVYTPDKTDAETPSITSILLATVSGAVADDGGVQTDETAEAQSLVVDDMTLLPGAPAVNDAYYFGSGSPFQPLRLNVSTAGVGVWTITWEYWNGLAWAALAGVTDNTNGFKIAGENFVQFTLPGDWATTTVGGIANMYWIRARVSAYTSLTVQPLGATAWIT